MGSRGRTTGEIRPDAVSGLRKTNRRHNMIATHAGKEAHMRCHLSEGPIILAARSEPIERRANDRHTRAIRRLIVSIFQTENRKVMVDHIVSSLPCACFLKTEHQRVDRFQPSNRAPVSGAVLSTTATASTPPLACVRACARVSPSLSDLIIPLA
jgi:hypothetical protein